MSPLPPPAEIMELKDGEQLTTKVLSFDVGEMTITPAHAPQGKTITALRLHVPSSDKSHFPYWWDVTGKTLVAQLTPILPSIIEGKRTLIITKHGVAPKARFSVEVR